MVEAKRKDRKGRKEMLKLKLLDSLCALCVLCGLCVMHFPTTSLAVDFKKEMAPRRWTERLVPEDLPPLEYPEYFNDLDKARMQSQTGR